MKTSGYKSSEQDSLISFEWKCEFCNHPCSCHKQKCIFRHILRAVSDHSANCNSLIKAFITSDVNLFMPNGLFYLNSLDRSISFISGVWLVSIITMFRTNV